MKDLIDFNNLERDLILLDHKAQKCLQENNPDEALKLWKMALLIDPNDPSILGSIADIHSQRGDFRKAREYYFRAADNDPDCYAYIFEIGNTFFQEGTFDKALISYYKAMDLAPGNSQILFALGKIFMLMGFINEALANLEEVRRLNPAYPGVNLLLGNIYSNLEEHELAFRYYVREIEANPNDIEAYKHLGLLCLEIGRKNEAQQYLFKAKEVDPEDGELIELMERYL